MNEVRKGVGAVFVVQEGIAIVGHMEVFEAYVRVEGVPIEATIRDLTVKEIDDILKKLTGTYESYRGLHKYKVNRQGELVSLEMCSKLFKYSIPLIPERLEDDFALFYTLSDGRKMYAEFHIKDDKVELLYERQKLIKRL